MRLAYPKGKKYRLNRPPKKRFHLMRTLLTQLITHDRIKTTYAKAVHLRPLAERIIALTKKYKKADTLWRCKKVFGGHITTKFAWDKLHTDIMDRLADKNCNYVRVKKLNRRKGDNALTGYIEIVNKYINK